MARLQLEDGLGAMPTSGTNRPGPMGPHPRVFTPGTYPVAIRLVRLGIDTDVETSKFSLSLPSDPSTPWVAAWYRDSALLGERGVVVIGGKTTVGDDGPSAFTRLAEVVAGDIVELTGGNGGSFSYEIESIDPAARTPVYGNLLKEKDAERLVLVGWDGRYPTALSSSTVVLATGIRKL